MSGIKKFGLFFIMALFIFSVTAGQHLSLRHITAENGLSQNSINCIYQDGKGFMWFGTQDGLNRYDGYEMISFRHDPADSNSISHSWIWDIIEDKDDNLWIATWHGLNRYNPHTNKFTVFLPDSTDPGAILGDRPAAVCEDLSGNIWVGTWGGGLNKFTKPEQRFEHYLHQRGDTCSLPDNFVRTLFKDQTGRIWAGTWRGLALMQQHGDSILFRNFFTENDPGHPSPPRVMSLAEDGYGYIWAGTFGNGLYKINPSNGAITHFLHDPENAASLASNDIASVLVDKYGIVWAGTISNGLNHLDPETGMIRLFDASQENANGIGSNEVYSLFEDRSGLLWIGAGGINIMNPNHRRFNVINTGRIVFTDITSFCEDREGDIWVGSNQNGLLKYDPATGKIIIFKYGSTKPDGLSCNNVSAITVDGKGNIWIGTRGGGLNLYRPGKDSFIHFPVNREDERAVAALKYINSLAADSSGRIWIGTYDQGLVRFDPALQEYTYFYARVGDPHTLSGNNILHVFIDSRQTLWAGIWGGGLCRFNPGDESFTRYRHDPDNPESLIDNIVHTIHEAVSDSGRVLWVGTSNGLSYFSPDRGNPAFHHFSTKNGLLSNVIYGILDDSEGNLWLSGNTGLTKFNPVSGKISHFNTGDGLQGNEFNSNACYNLKNKLFLFGGINGFNAFYPDSIRESGYKPAIVLTSLRVLNEERYTPLQLSAVSNIDLSFKENFFSFDFAALDFTEPSKNRYRYRLSGIDDNWIEAGHRHFANYTDIKPGRYTFIMSGTNSDGIWSNHIRQLEIRIRPPYWQTWWFYALMALLFTALLYSIHKYRVKRILELERLRIRIASDLHDDIGSALTRIAIHSEQLQGGKNPEKVSRTSKKIGTLSRSVISTMSDIVWSIDARNDSWGNMLDRMKDVVYNTLLLKEINVIFDIKGIEHSHKIPLKYRQNIFYIFKEAVTNIVKHSDATEVKIVMHKTPHLFKMEIADNGKGFDFEKIKYGNGLRNMKMRAGNIGGTLSVATDKGATVKLQVKGI